MKEEQLSASIEERFVICRKIFRTTSFFFSSKNISTFDL